VLANVGHERESVYLMGIKWRSESRDSNITANATAAAMNGWAARAYLPCAQVNIATHPSGIVKLPKTYKEVVKMMEKFRVPILVTLDSGEEELRTFSVEAWGFAEAIEIAEQQAQQDEHVVEVKPQVRWKVWTYEINDPPYSNLHGLNFNGWCLQMVRFRD
jgi:hypothetical protein